MGRSSHAHALLSLERFSHEAIKLAGPRYGPGIDPDAPNLELPALSDALDAAALNRRWQERVRSLADDLGETAERHELLVDGLFRRASVTPQRLIAELDRLAQGLEPSAVRSGAKSVRTLGQRCARRIAGRRDELSAQRNVIGRDPEKRNELDRLDSSIRQLDLFDGVLQNVLHYFRGTPGRLLADDPCLLITGAWGTGKTHLLCDFARRAHDDGVPVLLLLASSIDSGNPLEAIARKTQLARDGNSLLAALDGLGRSAGRRAVIMVDAINEGDRVAWRRSLRSLVGAVQNYEYVSLVLSCRRPFDETIVGGRDRSLMVRIEHRGFEEREFDAQLAFFNHYDIPAPRVPLLTPEFSRPLFLKILCSALAKLATRSSRGRQLKDVASGQKGMTYVLEYFVKEIGKPIERDFGLPAKGCWSLLKNTSDGGLPAGLAEMMSESQRDFLLRDEVLDAIRSHFGVTSDAATRVLDRLVADGLLAEDVRWTDGQPSEVVIFPYQRFSDHLIARHLLQRHLKLTSQEALRRSFYADRPLGRVFLPDRWRQQFAAPGIASALMIEFPERVKRTTFDSELVSYLPRARPLVYHVKDAFLDGLAWRSADSFTAETDRLVNFLLNFNDEEVVRSTFDVLVGLATRLGHPHQSSRLYEFVASLDVGDRDLGWSEFVRTREETATAERVVAWLELDSAHRSSDAQLQNDVRLASLFLTTTDRQFRDRVTRALTLVGARRPEVLFSQVLDGLAFPDPYVGERLLAAAYGVAMRGYARNGRVRAALPDFARRVVKSVLLPDATYATSHTLVRDYCTGVVELARIVDPHAIATQQVRYVKHPSISTPDPFRSATAVTDDEVEAVGHVLHMDFANYTIGRLIPDRGNYQDKHPEYQEVRRQILGRINDLGYRKAVFEDVDQFIGQFSWRTNDGSKTDRYGKKYSWIAFFEMYGLRAARGQLTDRRMVERCSDCDIDPSFPDDIPEWSRAIDDPFKTAPTELEAWLRSGVEPELGHLLVEQQVSGVDGPWVCLDGVVRLGSDDREIFAFLRGAFLRRGDIHEFLRRVSEADYLGNSKIPEGGADHYTFAGEIPWSRHFGCREQIPGYDEPDEDLAFSSYVNGDYEGVHVEIPVWSWAWESHHSTLNQVDTVTTPSPEACRALDLVGADGSFDLLQRDGGPASLCRQWPASRTGSGPSSICYLRRDLLERYLSDGERVLIWVVWGERNLHHRNFQGALSDELQLVFSEGAEGFRRTYELDHGVAKRLS